MRRNLTFAAITMMALSMTTSCSSDYDSSIIDPVKNEANGKAHVRLQCGTADGITLSHSAQSKAMYTRAALTANGKELTDLYILDYDKVTGQLLQVLHQTSTAADFAEPDLTLDYGEHTLKVIATRSKTPTLWDATSSPWNVTENALTPVQETSFPVALTSEKTSDTFSAQQDVSVGVGDMQTISITLDRMVARLVINSTDIFPTDCSTWDVSLQEHRTISWQTMDVIDAVNNHRTTDVSSLAGTTGTTITYYVLVPKDGYTTDITFTTNKANGSSYSSITVPNVTFGRNKTTTITGSFYNHKRGFSISVNDVWDESGYDINF